MVCAKKEGQKELPSIRPMNLNIFGKCKIHLSNRGGGIFITTAIFNNVITVGSLQSDCAVMIGQNHAPGWNAYQKQNSSISSQGQGNVYPTNINLFTDNDLIDFPINDSDIQPSAQIQAP